MLIEDLDKLPPEELDKLKKKIILKPLNSKEELQAWMYLFLGIEFPMGVVYPSSTHGPVGAMWRIYHLMKTGESQDVPQTCMLASRDSYKTLSAAALEVLLMVHFRLPVAHMAAIKQQSAKAIQYVNSFFRKIGPYLEFHGWRKQSDSKTYMEWITEQEETVYLNIVTATVAGANCISPNSTVETSNGVKLAKDVVQGDKLKSFDIWKNCNFYSEVLNTAHLVADAREVILEDGSNIILSHKHKVFTKRGWINAGNLKINDKLISDEQTYTSDQDTYDFVPKWTINSMIYGTLLGDASIEKLPNGNCRYQVFHCESQLSYLKNIQDTFEKNNIKATIVKDRKGYKLYTEVNQYFNDIYRVCYFNGKKKVNPMWMSHVDLEAIAFLIMDDGTTHRKEVGKYKESPIDIATLDFSNQENELIIKKIKKLGYNAKLHGFGKYNLIRIPIKYSRDISFDIEKYFVNCLKYKLLRSDDIRFCIENGKTVNSNCNYGFTWSDIATSNLKKGRDFRKKIYQKLNKKIVKIKDIGSQNLVGITIKDNNFNNKSFFANGLLVHNSEHVPLLFIDEVDVVQDPRALKEAKMIPSVYKGYFPLTIYLSTRKFAGGLMEKTLRETLDAGGEILRWNIVDVCSRITKEEAKVNMPKVKRYVSFELPLRNISPEEFEELSDEEKNEFEEFYAYAGIAAHPMLPVMRNYLVDRPQDNVGQLWKPVSAVYNNFRQTEPDMGEAQLLCNKPSASGLVYPRFDEVKNVLSVKQALQKLMGDDIDVDNFEYLKDYIKSLGVPIIGGGDWGWTDYTALVVMALLPGGDVYLLDTFIEQHLELDDIVKYGSQLQNEWNVDKWYVDQNYPMYLNKLRKPQKENGKGGAGWKIPKFKKDVLDGITALKSKVVDSRNIRNFYVIDTPNNKFVIDAFGEYRWALDGKGEVIEGKPFHDKDGVADVMDSIRYPAQNLFMKGKPVSFTTTGKDKKKLQKQSTNEEWKNQTEKVNQELMKDKINSLAQNDQSGQKIKKKGRIFWG